jgi:photosystem II stability/assembly factor-like uncharacterized protein
LPNIKSAIVAKGGIVNNSNQLLSSIDDEIETITAFPWSSDDSITWTSRTSGISNDLFGITYANNLFVAVGASGTILTSSDGITWTSRSSGTSYSLRGIAYANNLFVVVGANGAIYTSPDGITWTSRSSNTTNTLFGITYGNNLFVTVGASGTILTSSDSITWTSRDSGTSNYLNGITYSNNLFVIVGYSGTILTSPDGITWTSRTSGGSNQLFGIIYGNNKFVAVGASGTILTSTDGITWTRRSSGTSDILRGITYGNGLFVIVGYNGTLLFISIDLNTSITNSSLLSESNSVKVNDLYEVNPFEIFDINNAITVSGGASITSITKHIYVDSLSKYFAVVNSRFVISSSDGFTWTTPAAITTTTTIVIKDFIYDGSKFVAVGSLGDVFTSTDATTWTATASNLIASGLFTNVLYSNSVYVAVGTKEDASESYIYSSTDATTWTLRSTISSKSITKITYGNGKYITYGTSNVYYVSADGTTWTETTFSSDTTYMISNFIYNTVKAEYVVIYQTVAPATWYEAEVYTSKDLTTWTKRYTFTHLFGTDIQMYSSVFVFNGRYYILVDDQTSSNSYISISTDDFVSFKSFNGIGHLVNSVATTLTSISITVGTNLFYRTNGYVKPLSEFTNSNITNVGYLEAEVTNLKTTINDLSSLYDTSISAANSALAMTQ